MGLLERYGNLEETARRGSYERMSDKEEEQRKDRPAIEKRRIVGRSNKRNSTHNAATQQ